MLETNTTTAIKAPPIAIGGKKKRTRTTRRAAEAIELALPASEAVAAKATPMSPLRLIDQIVEALLPLEEDTPDVSIIAALDPIIGHFTVADAVLTIDALYLADSAMIFSGLRGNADDVLKKAADLVHKFICAGQAVGPACAAARAAYATRAPVDKGESYRWSPDDRRVLLRSLAWDIDSMKYGDGQYWSGSLFGGGTFDPDEAFEPEAWWDRHERLKRVPMACAGS